MLYERILQFVSPFLIVITRTAAIIMGNGMFQKGFSGEAATLRSSFYSSSPWFSVITMH